MQNMHIFKISWFFLLHEKKNWFVLIFHATTCNVKFHLYRVCDRTCFLFLHVPLNTSGTFLENYFDWSCANTGFSRGGDVWSVRDFEGSVLIFQLKGFRGGKDSCVLGLLYLFMSVWSHSLGWRCWREEKWAKRAFIKTGPVPSPIHGVSNAYRGTPKL